MNLLRLISEYEVGVRVRLRIDHHASSLNQPCNLSISKISYIPPEGYEGTIDEKSGHGIFIKEWFVGKLRENRALTYSDRRENFIWYYNYEIIKDGPL